LAIGLKPTIDTVALVPLAYFDPFLRTHKFSDSDKHGASQLCDLSVTKPLFNPLQTPYSGGIFL
jgi:ABC-type cobalt transport system substrate-binding protein